MKRRILAMPSRLAAVLGAAALTVTVVLPAAASPAPALAAPAGDASLACPGTSPDFALTTQAPIPVLLVHGLDDSMALWTKGSPSMEQAITSPLGGRVKIAYFDYHTKPTNWARDWVDNEDIGPKLAGCITWLAGQSASAGGPGKVIIVAHSMGGLAVRCAVDAACAHKSAASPDKIGLEITLGTPNLGTFPGYVTDGQWLCAKIPFCPDPLALAGTDAGKALDPGSAKLRSLAPLPASIPLHAFAGIVTATSSLYGDNVAADQGDLVVPTISALAGAPPCPLPDPLTASGYTCTARGAHSGPGAGTTIENCGSIQITQLGVWPASSTDPIALASGSLNPALPCWHLTEVTNPIWQAAVVAAIKTAAIAATAPPCTSAALASALKTSLPVNFVVSNFACQNGYAFAGLSPGAGGTGLPVIAILKQNGAAWTLIYGPQEDLCLSGPCQGLPVSRSLLIALANKAAWGTPAAAGAAPLPEFYYANLFFPEILYEKPSYPKTLAIDNADWIAVQSLDTWGPDSMVLTGTLNQSGAGQPLVTYPVRVIATVPLTCSPKAYQQGSALPGQAYVYSKITVQALSNGSPPPYLVGDSVFEVCS